MSLTEAHSNLDRLVIQALINAPTDIFILLDRDGIILNANQALADRVGVSLQRLPGRKVFDLHPPAHAAIRQKVLEKVLQTGELVRLNDEGPDRQYDSVVYPIKDESGNVVQVVVLARDVTEQRQAEAALRRAHEELEQRVIERTAELEAANRELRLEVVRRLDAENAWRRTAGRTEALARVAASANSQPEVDKVLQTICDEVVQVLPYTIASVGLYDESLDAFVPHANAAENTRAILAADPMPRNLYDKLMDEFGNPLIVLDALSTPPFDQMSLLTELGVRTLVSLPLYDSQELNGYLVLGSPGKIQPPTAETLEFLKVLAQTIEMAISNARLLKQLGDSQDRLRALSHHLVAVQETERRKLSRALNDDIGQLLSLLNFNLEQIRREVAGQMGADSPVMAPLDASRQQIDDLLNRIRGLALDLHPRGLDDLGLLAALLDYFERFTRFSGLQVSFKQSGLDRRFPAEIETAAFCIIQEALSNTARYSGAGAADVLVWATEDRLGVKVQDAGAGFNLYQVQQSADNHGLSGMSERAAACGGRLEIESTPGQGTTILLEIPIQPPDAGRGELP